MGESALADPAPPAARRSTWAADRLGICMTEEQ